MPVGWRLLCMQKMSALHAPGCSQFGFKYGCGLPGLLSSNDITSSAYLSFNFSCFERNAHFLFIIICSNEKQQLRCRSRWFYNFEINGSSAFCDWFSAPCDVCWSKSRCFPAVFKTKVPIPWFMQCTNIWVTCSKELPRLMSSVFRLWCMLL